MDIIATPWTRKVFLQKSVRETIEYLLTYPCREFLSARQYSFLSAIDLSDERLSARLIEDFNFFNPAYDFSDKEMRINNIKTICRDALLSLEKIKLERWNKKLQR